MQPADCYKILGVPFGASTEEVTAAYKKLSEKFHPDANAGDPFFRERFKEVQEAYQTLTNPITTGASRQITDRELSSDKNITSADPSIVTRKTRGKAIGGAIFGILLIAVVIFKFMRETKKASETEQGLISMGMLPKDSGKIVKDSTNSKRSVSILRDEVFVLGMMDDANARLEVYPSFTIFNAKNVLCHGALYFYDEQGNHLKTENRNEYTDSNGIILASLDFRPQQDQVKYSSGHSDLVLGIPYSRLYLSPGMHHVQYELLLYDNNWTVLDKSERLSLDIEQN
jgi:hypothetical protein